MKLDYKTVSVRMPVFTWNMIAGLLGPRERQVDFIRVAIAAEVHRRLRLSEERSARRSGGDAPASGR